MYQISQFSNKIKNTTTNDVFEQDDRLPHFTVYYNWLSDGNTPDYVPFFDGEELYSLTQKAIEIDLDYTYRIARLMDKHNDKFIEALRLGNTYTIPIEVIEERERLKNECNSKISELGISDYTYRQYDLRLMNSNIL